MPPLEKVYNIFSLYQAIMGRIEEVVRSIRELDRSAMDEARSRQDRLTKPQGSLGRLEELSIAIAGMKGDPRPRLKDKAIITMAADHGVAAEGVSAYPSEVTAQMVLNFLSGGAAINVLARHVGARIIVVDMGVGSELPDHPRLVKKRIGSGTGNIATGPAMTREQAVEAVESGIKLLEEEAGKGLDIVGAGDMGIGNTTPSAAITSVVTGISPREACGRGTGVDDAGFERKVRAVERAIAVNKPAPGDGIELLSKIGGFEIGGLAGVMLAAAAERIPVVIDGYISTAAALVAATIAPRCTGYMLASHLSVERGHEAALQRLGLKPLLNLDMRLGEGTGAALAISIAEAACKVLDEMATFEEAGVSESSL